tara:strand:+ start:1129 stop:2100 length:972 start_codon:yes stop_codon:yes gene_type:complete
MVYYNGCGLDLELYDLDFYHDRYLIANNTRNEYMENEFIMVLYDKQEITYKIALFIFVLCSSTFISSMIISRYVWAVMKNDFCRIYNKNSELLEYDTFLFECLEDFDDIEMKMDLDDDDVDEKMLKWKFVNCKTKFGQIIMHYDYKNEGFNYYCKASNLLPYEYLDVISRIYVVKYKCTKLYVESSVKTIDNGVAPPSNNKPSTIFYSQRNRDDKVSIISKKEYVSNKYKYKGTINKFMKICEMYNYDILECEDKEVLKEHECELEDLEECEEEKMGKYFILIKGVKHTKVCFSDLSDFSDVSECDKKDDSDNISFKHFKTQV